MKSEKIRRLRIMNVKDSSWRLTRTTNSLGEIKYLEFKSVTPLWKSRRTISFSFYLGFTRIYLFICPSVPFCHSWCQSVLDTRCQSFTVIILRGYTLLGREGWSFRGFTKDDPFLIYDPNRSFIKPEIGQETIESREFTWICSCRNVYDISSWYYYRDSYVLMWGLTVSDSRGFTTLRTVRGRVTQIKGIFVGT